MSEQCDERKLIEIDVPPTADGQTGDEGAAVAAHSDFQAIERRARADHAAGRTKSLADLRDELVPTDDRAEAPLNVKG